jgi:hypothetical protein
MVIYPLYGVPILSSSYLICTYVLVKYDACFACLPRAVKGGARMSLTKHAFHMWSVETEGRCIDCKVVLVVVPMKQIQLTHPQRFVHTVLVAHLLPHASVGEGSYQCQCGVTPAGGGFKCTGSWPSFAQFEQRCRETLDQ